MAFISLLDPFKMISHRAETPALYALPDDFSGSNQI
jgi:hypothetical protein